MAVTKQQIMESSSTDKGLRSYKAEEDLDAGRVVMYGTADNQVKKPTGTGVEPVGITNESADSGDTVPIATAGLVSVETAGAVSKGSRVYIADTNGKVGTTAVAGGCLGVAVTASSGAGEFIIVDMAKFGAGPFSE